MHSWRPPSFPRSAPTPRPSPAPHAKSWRAKDCPPLARFEVALFSEFTGKEAPPQLRHGVDYGIQPSSYTPQLPKEPHPGSPARCAARTQALSPAPGPDRLAAAMAADLPRPEGAQVVGPGAPAFDAKCMPSRRGRNRPRADRPTSGGAVLHGAEIRAGVPAVPLAAVRARRRPGRTRRGDVPVPGGTGRGSRRAAISPRGRRAGDAGNARRVDARPCAGRSRGKRPAPGNAGWPGASAASAEARAAQGGRRVKQLRKGSASKRASEGLFFPRWRVGLVSARAMAARPRASRPRRSRWPRVVARDAGFRRRCRRWHASGTARTGGDATLGLIIRWRESYLRQWLRQRHSCKRCGKLPTHFPSITRRRRAIQEWLSTIGGKALKERQA